MCAWACAHTFDCVCCWHACFLLVCLCVHVAGTHNLFSSCVYVYVCVCPWFIHTTCPCYRLLGRKSWRRLSFQESCSSLRTSLPIRQPLKDGCSTRQGLHSPLAPLITLQTSVPPAHTAYLTGFTLPLCCSPFLWLTLLGRNRWVDLSDWWL